MKKFDCILFDLDGTLIDTTPLILETFRYTFFHHFNIIKHDEELYEYLGIPLKKPFETLYPDKVDILLNTYREYNVFKHDECVSIFIGIPELLKECRQKGIKLGVVTSKRRDLAMRGMELFDLYRYMDVFIGFEDTTIHKPEGEPVLKAMKELGIHDGSRVLYVGDSPYDILCAKSAGVKSAAVTGWSYVPKNELFSCNPDFCIQTPAELLSFI